MNNITEHNKRITTNNNNEIIKAFIMIAISLTSWKCMNNANQIRFPKPVKLSLCEKIDSVIHQQKLKFRDIKQDVFYTKKDTEVYYHCAINLSVDSSEIIYKYQGKNLFFRGYFKSNEDSIHSVQLFDSLKQVIKDCLPDWETYNLIDNKRVFPFTRFIKDATQIELYYLKNGINDNTYTVGMVVEAFN